MLTRFVSLGGLYMLTQNHINDICNILPKRAASLFGTKLKDVILFGSYARGEPYL